MASQCDEDERLPKRLCAGRPSNGHTPYTRQGSVTPSFTGSAVHDGPALLVESSSQSPDTLLERECCFGMVSKYTISTRVLLSAHICTGMRCGNTLL
jgi:hypothetical protein